MMGIRCLLFSLLYILPLLPVSGEHDNHHHYHSSSHSSHSCIHDHLTLPTHSPSARSRILYKSNHRPSRSLEDLTIDDASRAPLRIHTFYDIKTTTEQTTLIQEKIMPQAVHFWSSTLRVFPVQNKLLFDRTCVSSFNLPDGTKRCASLNTPEICGATSVTIPNTWFNARQSCTSCDSGGTCSGCQNSAAGVGLTSTDFALLIHVESTTHCTSSPSTLAYAYACKWDQFDRPILGHINFCPDASAASNFKLQILTAKHEIAHALGFSSQSWPLMRHRDGKTPRTTRDTSSGVPAKSSMTCVDGTTKDVVAASSESLKYGAMRSVLHTYKLVRKFYMLIPNIRLLLH